jgi:single-strand DNA-binding protein
MSGSYNAVLLVGNVGRDPEIRSTKEGTKIANLSVATSESWKDRNSGERKERAEWHRVVCYNDNLTEIIEKYIRKGAKILVRGQLQTRKRVDKDGQERYTTEIVLQRFRGELTMLDSGRSGSGDRSGAGDGYADAYAGAPAAARVPVNDMIDDDIPF